MFEGRHKENMWESWKKIGQCFGGKTEVSVEKYLMWG